MRADSTGLFVSGCAAAFYLLRSSQSARASRPSKPALTFGATTVSSGGVTPRPKLLSPSAARAFAAEGARAPYNGAKNNPKPHETITDSSTLGTSGDRLVIVMVGLPGRGKTFIARKISHYLTFFHGAPCEVFNSGEYRRQYFEGRSPATKKETQAAEFFDPTNAENVNLREAFAMEAMDDLKKFLQAGSEVDPSGRVAPLGRVAIFDATNTSRDRRQWTIDQVMDPSQPGGAVVPSLRHILFVESVCDDETVLNYNYQAKAAMSPDYVGGSQETSIADFKLRIQQYSKVYEPMGADKHLSYVKVVDAGRQLIVNHIHGFLQGRVVQYLMNLHTKPRKIYFSRHGQSEYNKLKKIGGNSNLTHEGQAYAVRLGRWVQEHFVRQYPKARLWTSSLERTIQTASKIQHPIDGQTGWVFMRPKHWRALDELHAGSFDGMTYAEIEELSPDDFAMRSKDKLTYRYPRGESYLDVIKRLEPVVLELERNTEPVLVVAHQGILRILYAYFKGISREDSLRLKVPLNTVKAIDPHAYGCAEEDQLLYDPPGAGGEELHPPSH